MHRRLPQAVRFTRLKRAGFWVNLFDILFVTARADPPPADDLADWP
jgi:hypothetical protein